MAFDTNGTKLANLVNPEVMSAVFEAKLIDKIRFAPLATINTDLVNAPGSTIKVPVFSYIGAATQVAEGVDVAISQLTETTTPVSVVKYAKAVQISDEAMLSAYGNPVDEIADQLVKSIADAIEGDFITALATALSHTTTNTAIDANDVSDALVQFGEDIDGDKVLLCDPATYNRIRKANGYIPNNEVSANIVLRGYVGQLYGCDVVVTNRITDGKAYIVKPGALGLLLKRDTLVEVDRDIINFSNVFSVSKHGAAYLRDASKAIIIKHQ